jgi:hypothetical protein
VTCYVQDPDHVSYESLYGVTVRIKHFHSYIPAKGRTHRAAHPSGLVSVWSRNLVWEVLDCGLVYECRGDEQQQVAALRRYAVFTKLCSGCSRQRLRRVLECS